MFTIAIQPDYQLLTGNRYQSFSNRWIELLEQRGYKVRLVDIFKPNLRDQLKGCDGFMWWFAHLPYPRNIGKRLIFAIDHVLHIPVFPSWKTVWHFDDKVGQFYLLDITGLPIPETYVFWHRNQALDFCRTASYPIVIKLASGIISENVRLLNNFEEAEYWINRLFSEGTVSLDRPRVSSSRDIYKRFRAAARIFITGKPPNLTRRTELQRGYILMQEFLSGNEFDTRVTVIGNRAFGFRRFNRPNDFRASGSGKIDRDYTKIDVALIRLAFNVAQKLQTQSVAIDAISKGEQRVITEISYYYAGEALYACPGHWQLHGSTETGELVWTEGQTRPEDAILDDFLALINNKF